MSRPDRPMEVLYWTLRQHPVTGQYHTIGGHTCASTDQPQAVAVCGQRPGEGRAWADVPLAVDTARCCAPCRQGVAAILGELVSPTEGRKLGRPRI